MKFEASQVINVSPEQAFAYLADFTKDSNWKSDCVACRYHEGNGTQGSKIDYTMRVMGKKLDLRSEVSTYEPGAKVAFEVQGDRKAVGWRTFEAVDGGTRVTLGYEADESAFFGPIAAVASSLMKRAASHDLETVKAILEHEAAA